MAGKYDALDRRLFAWLRQNRVGVTTAAAIAALKITSKTQLRHISRRFSQLEDRQVLKCRLKGTTRICDVVAEIPLTLSKQHWRANIAKSIHLQLVSAGKRPQAPHCDRPSIPATTSEEFLAAGGVIERLEAHWDHPMTGSKPMGPSFFDDFD